MYEYRGVVTRIIDENALFIRVDLGFGVYTDVCFNINIGSYGPEVVPLLKKLLLNKVVYFVSKSPEYGVYDADIAFDVDRELFLLTDEIDKFVLKDKNILI